MEVEEYSLKDLLSRIVDNRGKTCPTAETGTALIATNCIKDDQLYPVFENVRWVDQETMETWFRGHPEPGDILFVLKGSPGRCCLVPDPINFCIAQDMLALRADESKVSQKFLFALLRSSIVRTAIDNLHVGTMIPHFKKGDFNQLKFQIPKSRKIQEWIGDQYFILSDKIELNRRMNTTLEGMAQALFKSWFVDFDPVIDNALVVGNPIPDELADRAEVRRQALEKRSSSCVSSSKDGGGASPGSDIAPAMSSGKMDGAGAPSLPAPQFPAAFQQTESMGWIPEGWKAKPLGEESLILNGHAFKSEDYCEDGIFVLRTKNFDANGLSSRLGDDVFLPESFSSSHESYLSQPFDFHLVMVGASIGKTSLLLPHMLPALRNQNMWCFRPKAKSMSKAFLNLSVQKKVEDVMSWASGSARSFFRKSDFRSHEILVPSNLLLAQFEQAVSPMYLKISICSAQADELTKLRDTLLPKLISGELSVSESEKVIQEAAQ